MNFNDARLLIQGAFSRVISIMVFAVYFMDCLAWWARQYIYIDTTISYSPFPYVYTLTYYRSVASYSEIHKHKLGYTQIYCRDPIGWSIPTFETFLFVFHGKFEEWHFTEETFIFLWLPACTGIINTKNTFTIDSSGRSTFWAWVSLSPIFFTFMQISGTVDQIIGWCPHLWD